MRQNADDDLPILVFGGTGGIGSALSRACAAKGRHVHLAARDEDRLGDLADELGATTTVCDVLDEATIKTAVEDAAGDDGALGGLAYCVGSIDLRPLKRVTVAEMLDAYRLNTVGAAMAVQAAATMLKKGKGSVVLFSTVAVAQGFPNHTIIAAAKGGVEGLVRSFAAELAPDVRVNAVAPSLTRTPLAKSLTRNETLADGIAKLHPLGRLGEPEDVAALAAFLLSNASGWISGQIIGVDGGRSALRLRA